MLIALSDNRPYSQLSSLSKWTEELNITEPLKPSIALTTGNRTRKTIHRWHLTPYCLSKLFPGHPSTSWSTCGSAGTIAHPLWLYRSINSFKYKQIFALIATISQITTTPNPLLALLHLGIEQSIQSCSHFHISSLFSYTLLILILRYIAKMPT